MSFGVKKKMAFEKAFLFKHSKQLQGMGAC